MERIAEQAGNVEEHLEAPLQKEDFIKLLETPEVKNFLSANLHNMGVPYNDVEDIVQTTLYKAYKALDDFEARSKKEFFSWLLTIAKRTHLDNTRRNTSKVSSASSVMDGVPEGQLTSKDNTLNTVMSRDDVECLMQAVNGLSPKMREAMLLSLEGFPNHEIARQLGISYETANVRIFNGRRSILNSLPEDLKNRASKMMEGSRNRRSRSNGI